MKTVTHFFLLKLVSVLLLLTFLDQSCKKADHNPDQDNAKYIGTWLDMRSVDEGEATVEVKNILTLSTDSLSYFAQYGITALGPWIGVFKLNGTAADSAGMVLKVTVTSISVPKFDANDNITGYTVYKPTDPTFLQLLSQFNFEQSFGFKYSISGNQMTLKRDFNNDGDFSDVNETIVYTKQ